MEEHAMQRKLVITGTIVSLMVILLISTRMVPQRSKFTDSSLNTNESFGENSNASIMMTSRKYNKRDKFMVIKFKVTPTNNQLLDPNNIKFNVKMINPQQVNYQVISLANNQYVLVLNNLSSGYRAIQITAKNKQPDISQFANGDADSDATVNADGTVSSSSSSEDSEAKKNSYNFIINENNKFVDNKLVKQSQKQYAIDSLNKSIKDTKQKIKNGNDAIKAYKMQIDADNKAIQTTKDNAQYQVNQSDDDDKVKQAEGDIKQQQTNITSAQKKLDSYHKQVSLYQKQIRDIENGKYKFPAAVKTGKMK